VGRIIGGFATSHTLFQSTGVEAAAERVWQGMCSIARQVQAARPDVLVLVGNDHLNNFSLGLQVPFVVGVADEYTPLGDMGIPRRPFPGARAFAEALVRYAAERGFDLARAEEWQPDHGLALPHAIVSPAAAVPVMPLFINAAIDPIPSPRRCYALGRALHDMVGATRPESERVVVLATGGLSHWLCDPQEGRVNVEFDREFIATLIGGRGAELAELTQEQLLERGGNGALELTAWIFLAGCLPHARGECVYYEPMPQWITGMGGIALRP
jgi:protocatechuate 4,5-dioxygenase beta chain/2'-aminobiphenyl-2,3-diol 1,2-dioxygenase large subunit